MAVTHSTVAWSEEEDDLLRRCVAKGDSASAIAALLGDLFGTVRTRNATIGRASRLGLRFGASRPAMAIKAAAAREAARPARRAPQPSSPPTLPPAPPPRPAHPKPAPAETKVFAANLLRLSEQRRVEAERGQPSFFAEKLAEMDAAGPDSEGVLFLERSLFQCAWPQPGWDAAPVTEKRVCGKPVKLRATALGAEPTAWCPACFERAHTSARRRLDVKGLSSIDRNVTRVA
ncbi:MAG: hypothetical protein DI527_18235 [Chelatococcus sp.]|nr:MAG: hypothetical protein DI527_18235 [Chelatococcus sp.]